MLKDCVVIDKGILVIIRAGRSNSPRYKECSTFTPRDLLLAAYQPQHVHGRESDLRVSHTPASHSCRGLAGDGYILSP